MSNISRRELLQAGLAGLSVSFLVGCTVPVRPKFPEARLVDAVGWVQFVAGRYVLYLPRVEMGQNVLTALKQIACDELDIEWQDLEAQLPNTAQIARVRATVGSQSIRDFALPLAQACATLRNAVAAGYREGQLEAVATPAAQLRSLGGRGKYVGRQVVQEQHAAIVRGEPLYVADVRRPGQLHGRVLRAPASPELPSKVTSYNEAAARAVEGFIAVIRDDLLVLGLSEGLGIIARTPRGLDLIEAALAPTWSIEGSFGAAQVEALLDIDRRLTAKPRRSKQLQDDDLDAEAPWDLDLRFDVPLAAHAAIEPRAAVAELDAYGCMQLWVGSQDVFYQRDVVAKRLGFNERDVIVHGQRVGGAFGGKTLCTVELEAAVLAKAVAAPVKVQWTRAQEFQLGFHRPPSSHRIRARLADGRITDWWHGFASSHIFFTNAALPRWLQRITDFFTDAGVARGALLPYRIKAKRIEFDVARLPVYTGPWRGLGAGPNLFAIESTVDECARQAGIDPLTFRLQHLEAGRLTRVLSAVAAACSWTERPSATPTKLRGRGIACGSYENMSYAAVVADVEVEIATGSVKVLKLWCAHDCGRIINPDQVRAQCEGNLVWGLGMVLKEALPIASSQIAATSFAESPIPTAAEVPAIEVVLLEGDDPPSGAGETAIVAAGGAIANAVRDASGMRIQQLPLRAERLQRVLSSRTSRGQALR